ncbi:MAG: hypothetical protein ACSLEX_01870 [Minisyncoccota bacterium]
MKTLLNLLPEDKKRAAQSRIRFRFFLWQFFLLFALEIFYLSILGSIVFILDVQLRGLKQQDISAHSQYVPEQTLGTYQQKFKEINGMVTVINAIDTQHLSFTEIIILLEETLPTTVLIENLTTQDYTVLLSGRAATREDLLMFETRLKESACVEKVNIPLSNLFSQENIDFQMDITLKKTCLQKKSL